MLPPSSPIITSHPLRATIGGNLTIRGHHLRDTTGVMIAGQPVAILHRGGRADSYIVVTVPAAPVTGVITVVTPHGNASSPNPVTIQAPPGPPPPPPVPPPPRVPSAFETALTSNPLIGGFVQSALPFTGVAAVAAITANVRGSARAGGAAVDALTQGAGSAVSRAYGVGVQLGEQILNGVLSPLGKTGSALSGLFGAGARGVGGLLGMAGDAGSKLLRTGGSIVGGGVALAAGGLGAAAGSVLGLGLGSAPGFLVGGAIGTGIGLIGMKIVQSIAEGVGGVVGKVGEAFGKIGDIASGALRAVIDILQDVTKAATETSLNVLKLNQLGGYSMGQSAGLVNTLGFFGMSSQQVAGRFSSPYSPITTGVGSAMMGMPNIADDPAGFMRAGARGFDQAQRGGPISLGVYRAQLNAGFGAGADADFIPKFGLGENRINKVLDFQKGLGVSPLAVDAFGKDVSMLQGMITGFADFLKVTLGTALIPVITKGLESAANYIVRNKDAIIGAIFAFGKFVYADLPPMVLGGVTMIAKGVAYVLHGMEGFAKKTLPNLLDAFQKFFDSLLDKIRPLATAFGINLPKNNVLNRPADYTGYGENGKTSFWERSIFNVAADYTGGKDDNSKTPWYERNIFGLASDLTGGGYSEETRNREKDAATRAAALIKTKNDPNSIGNRIGNALGSGGTTVDSWAKSLDEMTRNAKATQDSRAKEFDLMRQLVQNTGETAAATKETAQRSRNGFGIGDMFQRFLPGFLGLLVNQQAREFDRP